MKILVIEDDDLIRKIIKSGLEDDGVFTVFEASDGETGLNMAWDSDYALIILDLMLPKKDGLKICKELRENKINTPILMVTAKDTVPERVEGLLTGADDYLIKPFHFDELVARVKALIRRDTVSKENVIITGDLELHTAERQLFINGEEVTLSSREYSLLESLIRNEGRTVSRETIQYKIWNNEDSLSNTVDVYIRSLRRKIERGLNKRLIHTVHGLGYMFKSTGKK